MTTEQATAGVRAQQAAAVPRVETAAQWQYLQEIMALTRRWYIELTRERLNLLFSVLQPAIWLIFFGAGVGRAVDEDVVGTDDYIAFMLPGIIAFTVVGNGVAGAMPLMWDKEQGYLDKLMSMPIARSSIIVSRFVFMAALGSVQSLLVIIVALVMGVDIATGVAGVVVMLAAAALLGLAVTAVYCGLAYWVPGHGTFFAITGFITLPLLFMSNAFVPLDAMPGWMEAVARANPLTYAIEAMRILVLDSWEAQLGVSFAVLAGASLLCLFIGTYQFGRTTAERITETGA
jgi:ABC-2 type transport system permease protein